MPTYLTPGVYVEEVPSTSKPIEGVSTSIAAFVGLAPGGPVNTPMRISNWTQFAKIYGDPVEPENGPFMEGAYLAHSVFGFFQNGGSVCWIVRAGKTTASGSGPAAQAALPAAADSSVETLRLTAQKGVDGQVKVEVVENPGIKHEGDGDDKPAERRDLQDRDHRGRRDRGVRRPDAQEGPQQPRDEGQRGVEAHQDRGDRQRAARGAARARGRQVRAVGAEPSRPRSSTRRTSPATSPSAVASAGSPPSTRSRWCASPTCGRSPRTATARSSRISRASSSRTARTRATGWRSSTRPRTSSRRTCSTGASTRRATTRSSRRCTGHGSRS